MLARVRTVSRRSSRVLKNARSARLLVAADLQRLSGGRDDAWGGGGAGAPDDADEPGAAGPAGPSDPADQSAGRRGAGPPVPRVRDNVQRAGSALDPARSIAQELPPDRALQRAQRAAVLRAAAI